MTKRDDDNPDEWLMSGPVAWFVIGLMAIVLIGFAAWGFAEFRAQRLIDDAIAKAGNFHARAALRTELDLLAQQTMAQAAMVAIGLSALSMAFIAATVWFTRDAARLSRKALIESLGVSRRELMPHVTPIAFSDDALERNYIRHGEEVGEPMIFRVKANIQNYGKTPYYIKNIICKFLVDENYLEPIKDDSVIIRKIIAPEKSETFWICNIPARVALALRYQEVRSIKMIMEINSSDIFYSDRQDRFKFIIFENHLAENGQIDFDHSTLWIQLDSSENPLRSWATSTDGVKRYDPAASNS